MKKFLAILLTAVFVLCLVYAVGCVSTQWRGIEEGTYDSISESLFYESNDINYNEKKEHIQITHIQLLIKQIAKNEYDMANSINVIEDCSLKDRKYYSLDLHFVLKDLSDGVRVTVKDLKYESEAKQYRGFINCNTEVYCLDTWFLFILPNLSNGYRFEWGENIENLHLVFSPYLELKK